MNASTLLADLERRGVTLTLLSSRLNIDAPAGALTAEDRQALATHKAALLALLNADADVEGATAWLERRAAEIRREEGVTKPESERRAWLELKARLDGDPLRGPRRTAFGTIVWSDPAEPPLEHFGEAN